MMKTSRRRRSREAGFTLIETLIATAMMAAILAALATVTAQWLPNWNRGFARIQRNETLALGIERLVADLAAAQFVTAGREFAQPVFEGGVLGVTFVRPTFGPNALPGLEVVRLAETAADRGRAVVRSRAPFVPVATGVNDRTPPVFTDPVVLIREPYRVSFNYAGPDRVWKESWRNADELPRAVRISVRDGATQRTLAVSTATMVHVDLAAKCVSALQVVGCSGAQGQQPPDQAGQPQAAQPQAGANAAPRPR
jgi:general secretion pathway protein J